jgi:hypothetical protein
MGGTPVLERSVNDALLQDLLDAGTPPMLVVRVGAEMARLAAEAAALERRRAADRERQQARRDTERNVMSRDVADIADEPSLDKSPQTPKINPTPSVCVGDAPARKARPFSCPADIDSQHWADFLENRKRKRLANTATAYQAQLRKLADLADDEWPPGRIVQFAAERGWGAFFDPRESHGISNGQRPANDFRKPHRRADEIDDAARELGFGGG